MTETRLSPWYSGSCTWQRKHVDWEIGSSLRDTRLTSSVRVVGNRCYKDTPTIDKDRTLPA